MDSFTLHAGDAQGVLKGSALEYVATLTVNDVTFTPGKINSTMGSGELPMVAQDARAAEKLKQGESARAQVTLTDGRTMMVNVAVGAPRPGVELIGKSVHTSASGAGSNIELANQDELPEDARLTFSVRAQSPPKFRRGVLMEVATQDEAFSTTLSLDNGGMTLENAKVALATLDPAKAFGGSAFGPLKFRVVDNGTAGDWQPLATLVRLPELHDLKCPPGPDEQCRLSGSNLFLVDSVASDPQFEHPIEVPDGFPGYVLPVPHPEGGELYLKLRDDPSVVNQVTLAAEKLPPPPGESQRHPTRAAYREGESAPSPGSSGQSGQASPPTPQSDPGNGSKPAPQPSTTQQPSQTGSQPQSSGGPDATGSQHPIPATEPSIPQ